MQAQVITVGVDLLGVEGRDFNTVAEIGDDFFT
jgi:hypothetical protein